MRGQCQDAPHNVKIGDVWLLNFVPNNSWRLWRSHPFTVARITARDMGYNPHIKEFCASRHYHVLLTAC